MYNDTPLLINWAKPNIIEKLRSMFYSWNPCLCSRKEQGCPKKKKILKSMKENILLIKKLKKKYNQ